MRISRLEATATRQASTPKSRTSRFSKVLETRVDRRGPSRAASDRPRSPPPAAGHEATAQTAALITDPAARGPPSMPAVVAASPPLEGQEMQATHVQVNRTRRLRRLTLIAAFAAAIVVPGLAFGGPAQASTTAAASAASTSSGMALRSTIVPDTASSCGYGSSSGNTYTCMYVNGGGLYINYAEASASVVNSGRTLQECIRGPQGTIGCTAFTYVRPGYTLFLDWFPYSYEPAGNYCANTWRLNSNGSHTEIGHQCVNVHS